MKLSSETLQILPYFWNKKTQIVFLVFHFEHSNFVFLTVDAMVYVDIDIDRLGHPLLKIQSYYARNEKPKKLSGFSHFKNMANFEPFRWTISSSINL